MIKGLRIIACYALCMFLLCGCASKERAAFDLGSYTGKQYKNEYFGLQFDAGKFSILDSALDDRLLPLFNMTDENKSYVLSTLSMGENTEVGSYPLIQSLAYDVSSLPRISSAKEYVEEAASAFNEANAEFYEIEKDEITLNGRKFASLLAQLFTPDGQMIYLDLYVTVEGDYFVVFAALSLDPQQSVIGK